jgi:hypothetical protein
MGRHPLLSALISLLSAGSLKVFAHRPQPPYHEGVGRSLSLFYFFVAFNTREVHDVYNGQTSFLRFSNLEIAIGLCLQAAFGEGKGG